MLKFKYYDNTCKKYIIEQVLEAFFSIHKVHNMLAIMLDLVTRGWGWSFNMLASRGFLKL
jgi:hypothetical protein